MKPMIERTLEVQDENDGFQLIDLDNLSNNEMDLDAAFPSQVIWTSEITDLKHFTFTISVAATADERQYHSAKQELYDSERVYLKFLLTIQRFFMDALEEMRTNTRNSGFKKAHFREMFTEIPTIYNINKELLRELRVSNVYTAFTKMSPFLKTYSTYARNYPSIIRAYDELCANSTAFNELITRQQNKPACQGNNLMALMIMPIQRIPRYIMMLTKMRECSSSYDEREQLDEVLSKLAEISCLTESCIRDYENQQKLYKIQQDLGRSIVAPGRRFVREGPLYKISQSSDGHDERMFWLFNDILVYGKRRFIMPKFSCSCIIPLKHCKLDYKEVEGSLSIYCKDHSVTVTSDNYDTLREWNGSIQTAVERMNILRSTLRKESSRQPVRNFKNRLVKKFTNKFSKKTYPVNDDEDESETPIFRNDSERTPAIRQKKYRKRKADLAFEAELKEVLEKRNQNTAYHSKDIDDSGFKAPKIPARNLPLESSTARSTLSNNFPSFDISPIKAIENIPPSPKKEMIDVGVDEADKVPRNRGTARKVIAERNGPVVRREESCARPRVLSQPEIRLYSYQEPSAPQQSEQHTPDMDSSFEYEPERSKLAREKVLPWWVLEATPAVYTQKKRGGLLDNVRNNCSLM